MSLSPTKSRRIVYLIFERSCHFIFILGTLYTSLINPPRERNPELSHSLLDKERRKLRVCMGFWRRVRNGEGGRGAGDRVQERAGWKDSRPPGGLRYSPDIEMSKPSHHWNCQSLPLPPFSPRPISLSHLSFYPDRAFLFSAWNFRP